MARLKDVYLMSHVWNDIETMNPGMVEYLSEHKVLIVCQVQVII